jgi:PAT family beta-lactamase induction signal transducer AmpG
LPKFIAGFSGDFVNAHGYADFFNATAMLGMPVLILVALAWHFQPPPEDPGVEFNKH